MPSEEWAETEEANDTAGPFVLIPTPSDVVLVVLIAYALLVILPRRLRRLFAHWERQAAAKKSE